MSKFGWDLPPGVTTSMLPGNSPGDEANEAAAADLFNSFLLVTLNYFTVEEIMTLWREAAETAAYALEEQATSDRAEAEAEAEAEIDRLAAQYWEERP